MLGAKIKNLESESERFYCLPRWKSPRLQAQGFALTKFPRCQIIGKSVITSHRVLPRFFRLFKPTLKFVLDIQRGAGILYWMARSKVIAIF